MNRPAVTRAAIARAVHGLREADQAVGGVLLFPDRSVAVLTRDMFEAMAPKGRGLTPVKALALSGEAALDDELAAWDADNADG